MIDKDRLKDAKKVYVYANNQILIKKKRISRYDFTLGNLAALRANGWEPTEDVTYYGQQQSITRWERKDASGTKG